MNEATQATADPTTLALAQRTEELQQEQLVAVYKKCDRTLGTLLLGQWVVCMAVAYWYSPLTWIGETASPHLHLLAAVGLIGLAVVPPAIMAWRRPGRLATRLSIGAAQMVLGAVAIHLAGGRIEAHFHVFASLGILTCYRDWKVLVLATVVVATDHLLRGVFWPLSVFGDANVWQWRWLEHAVWVVFEDIFLLQIVFDWRRECRNTAQRQAALETDFARLHTEISGLVDAAKGGRLATRADENRFEGPYREVLALINETLGAIAAPITEASSVLSELSHNNLRQRVQGKFAGDFDRLGSDINGAIDSLTRSVRRIRTAGEDVARTTEDVRSGSLQIDKIARSQVGELVSVVSSLEEIRAMTKETAGNAVNATDTATDARSAVEAGKEVVATMETVIEQILEAAEQQGKIVEEIDNIAFTTNLLALNASVEAAQAGDAGKGFAVVAEEVRNLAQRAAQATQSAASMIRLTESHSRDGAEISQRVRETLDEISQRVEKSEVLIREIAAATEEQSTGIQTISDSVEQLESTASQNSRVSEQSLDIAERLNRLVGDLYQVVEQFETEPSEEDSNWRPTRSTGELELAAH